MRNYQQRSTMRGTSAENDDKRIDRTLQMMAPPGYLLTMANTMKEISIFMSLVDLVPAFQQNITEYGDALTFLAPLNSAFEPLSTKISLLAFLQAPQNREYLVETIGYHFLLGISPTAILGTGQYPTFSGGLVNVQTTANGSFTFNYGAHLVNSNIFAGRGLIQEISALLIPPTLQSVFPFIIADPITQPPNVASPTISSNASMKDRMTNYP